MSVALHLQVDLEAFLLLGGFQVHHHQDFQDAEDRQEGLVSFFLFFFVPPPLPKPTLSKNLADYDLKPASYPHLDSKLQGDLEDLVSTIHLMPLNTIMILTISQPADSSHLPDSSHQDRDEDTRRRALVGDEVIWNGLSLIPIAILFSRLGRNKTKIRKSPPSGPLRPAPLTEVLTTLFKSVKYTVYDTIGKREKGKKDLFFIFPFSFKFW